MSKSADELLKLENQLCFQLYSASRLMTKIYQPLLKPLDLTYPQYLVMLVLWEMPMGHKFTVTMLGERLKLDSGTLTPLLKRLESKRLIQRQRSHEDERQVWVRLSALGESLKQQAKRVPEKLMCEAGVKNEEVAVMRDMLKKLFDTLPG
ncbi:MAG: MarR family transcriptional regulator [Bermanella sp.]|jgi:DNA-binding MarR family transcriptional regulator|nr:MarR family transcriptional regulator [Bermanella sp.]|tara:strand:- start:943 stop:1392 length:450 start_codon:yes stop_codon:yes gene_type:complete